MTSRRKPITQIPRRISVRQGLCDFCGRPAPGSVSPCPTCLASVLADEATGFERRILDALRALGDHQLTPPQVALLRTVATLEDVPDTVAAVAGRLGLTRGAARARLVRLRARGYLSIVGTREFSLTPAARQALDQMDAAAGREPTR